MGSKKKILRDQGHNFESKLITKLCFLAHTKKLHTTLYKLQTYGQCERFNSTLISMIVTLLDKAKINW